MKYPRIASELYSSPWQITSAKFQEISAAFEHARKSPSGEPESAADTPVGPEVEDWWTGQKSRVHPQIQVRGTVALASVKGVLGRNLSKLSMQCGGFDTGLFQEQLANIRDDAAVRTLVIDFDSPGGMAAGNTEICASIREVAAAGKRVIGYASGNCCSAAYFLACACDEFHAHPASSVGSISTIWAGVDSSRAWEKEGYELKLFATGKFKATGYPGKSWTKEEEANCWNIVKPLDDEFKGYVSSRRGLSADLMEGQWWTAKHAPAGIVDSTSFLNLSAVLEAAYQL